jgi:Skp family chaperone for outer membrane proteins
MSIFRRRSAEITDIHNALDAAVAAYKWSAMNGIDNSREESTAKIWADKVLSLSKGNPTEALDAIKAAERRSSSDSSLGKYSQTMKHSLLSGLHP